MRKQAVLITGAAGEIGHALIDILGRQGDSPILSIDLQPIPEDINHLT